MTLKNEGFQLELRKEITQRDKAMAGDLVWVLTPSTVASAPTAAAWTRTVLVELQSADGEVHSWFSKAITSGVSIASNTTNVIVSNVGQLSMVNNGGGASTAITAGSWVIDIYAWR